MNERKIASSRPVGSHWLHPVVSIGLARRRVLAIAATL